MERKPEQQVAVNDTQSKQEQIEETIRARIEVARRAADFLAGLFKVTKGRPGEKSAADAATPSSSAALMSAKGFPVPPAPLKRCDCGHAFTALQWRALAFTALERMSDDLAIEIRECAGCRAKLGLIVHIVPCEVAQAG